MRTAGLEAPYVGVTAALGPTNTGKTHRAVERMLEHRSGMLGLPLRLLAREVYDRVSARIGERRVALVTGEEKRVPARPDYWICTVESMPVAREVDFLAVDEIQLIAHPQRGHVFTDRLLHARGLRETWFMGADTAEPLVRDLVPTVTVDRHPRLSQLRHAGSLSLGALPPRTAVVAFSAGEVYEIAERLRVRRGGAAVVLGALSPRTRNAQVALYQAGEVDYLVATDAIGMGLNMDVDTVAFASLRKFDGREVRELEPAELAQIAGRAGRAQNDGQFCTLAPAGPLPRSVVDAIETHRFPPLRGAVWRNADLDFRSIDTLVESLRRRPDRKVLTLVRRAEDFESLTRLAARSDVRELAHGRAAVERLWAVCQIPDFRKLLLDGHVELLAEIFRQLSGSSGRLDPDWMAERIDRIDDVDGGIDTLMTRIAFVRTWTYVSSHPRWLFDAEHWRARTRAIEDRLSDALHERLVARFVAREGRQDVRRRPSRTRVREPWAKRSPARARGNDLDRRAVAEGPFAKLLDLQLDPTTTTAQGGGERRDAWVQALVDAPHERFAFDDAGWVLDADLDAAGDDARLARLTRGVDLLHPEVALALGSLGAGAQARVRRRLVAWTRDLVDALLRPLRGDAVDSLSSHGRGVVYQLERGLGTIHRDAAAAQLDRLRGRDARVLESLGVRVGARLVWLPRLLRGEAPRVRALLCTAALPPGVHLSPPRPGAVSLDPDPQVDPGAYTALGFPVIGGRAIRADIVERLHAELQAHGREGSFAAPARVASLAGVRREALAPVLDALGCVEIGDGRWRLADGGEPRGGRRRSGPRPRS